MYIKNKFSLIIVFILFSCTKEVFLNSSTVTDDTVFNCLYRPDSIYMSITTSVGLKDTVKELSSPFTVLFSSTLDTQLVKYNGRGFYQVSLHEGKEYQMRVNQTPSMLIATAKDKIPLKIVPQKISFNYNVLTDKTFGQVSELTITFADPSAQKNWYEIMVYGITDSGKTICLVSSFDKVFKNEGLEDNAYYTSFIYSDELIDGKEYSLKMQVSSDSYYGEKLAFEIHFRSISESYYKYRKSIDKQIDANTPSLWDNKNGNKPEIYTNITGKHGIFGGFNESIDTAYVE